MHRNYDDDDDVTRSRKEGGRQMNATDKRTYSKAHYEYLNREHEQELNCFRVAAQASLSIVCHLPRKLPPLLSGSISI
jgi:hypothetical protein